MKQRNQKLVTGLSAAMLLMGANVALAEIVTVPASVTVNNAIDFTFTGTLNFGEVRASADSTAAECSGLVLSPTSLILTAAAGAPFTTTCTSTGTSVIQAVGGTVARPVFTVAGIAPFTTLDLIVPNTAINLTAATGPGTAQFQLINFTAQKTSAPAAPITLTAGAGTFAVDAAGGATFTVGATLITDPAAPTTVTYQDLAYNGSFDVEVTY
jgi:hypothetical protein